MKFLSLKIGELIAMFFHQFRVFFFFSNNKKKLFKGFGIAFLILSSFLLPYLSYWFSHFEKELKISVSASVHYDNLSNGFSTEIEGLEVAVWKDGAFSEFIYTDVNSEVSFMAAMNSSYELKVTQGSSTTVFDVDLSLGAPNDFLIEGWELDLGVYIEGIGVDSYILYILNETSSEWFEIGLVVCEDGHYSVLPYLNVPSGTFGVMSETIADYYNFDIVQSDVSPFYTTLNILDIPTKPKKKKKKRYSKTTKIESNLLMCFFNRLVYHLSNILIKKGKNHERN